MKTIDKKTVKIRRMVSSDVLPTVGIWWADIPNKEKLVEEIPGPLDLSFIAEYEGILIGFILAKIDFSGYPMTSTAGIYLVAVNPEYRKHGIGTMMIEALENFVNREILGPSGLLSRIKTRKSSTISAITVSAPATS